MNWITWILKRISHPMRDLFLSDGKAAERFIKSLTLDNTADDIRRYQWLWPQTRRFARTWIGNDAVPQFVVFSAAMGWITKDERQRKLQKMLDNPHEWKLTSAEQDFIRSELSAHDQARESAGSTDTVS
jgi:hypothetical protein